MDGARSDWHHRLRAGPGFLSGVVRSWEGNAQFAGMGEVGCLAVKYGAGGTHKLGGRGKDSGTDAVLYSSCI